MTSRLALALVASVVVGGGFVGTAAASGSGAPTTPAAGATTVPPIPATTPPQANVPIFVSAPPPGAVQLLDAVNHDEGQLVSLAAITEAHILLAQAKAVQAKLVIVEDRAVGAWDVARMAVEDALGMQLQAEGRASFIYSALGQLGLAEYTGATSVAGATSLAKGDVATQETQMDQAELTNVAATATSGSLEAAEARVAHDKRVVGGCRRVAGRAWAVLLREREALGRADSQLATSLKDVGLARRWALKQGTAPLYPVETLLKLEGPLGRQVLGQQTRRSAHTRGATTTVTTTTGQPGTVTGTSTPPSAALSPEGAMVPASRAVDTASPSVGPPLFSSGASCLPPWTHQHPRPFSA